MDIDHGPYYSFGLYILRYLNYPIMLEFIVYSTFFKIFTNYKLKSCIQEITSIWICVSYFTHKKMRVTKIHTGVSFNLGKDVYKIPTKWIEWLSIPTNNLQMPTSVKNFNLIAITLILTIFVLNGNFDFNYNIKIMS